MADSINPTPTKDTIDSLRRLIEEQSPEILNQPDKLSGLLLDHRPRIEVNLLVSALKAGIPHQITGARLDTPPEVLIGNLRNRMVQDHGFSATSAEWVVRAWFGALRPNEVAVGAGIPPPLNNPVDNKRDEMRNFNRAGNFALAGLGAVILIVIVSIYAYQMLREPPYEFEELAFYDVVAPQTEPFGEAVNYNSWCKYPKNECASITAFRVAAPYVQARLGVGYSSKREAEIPVKCTASNPQSPVAVSAESNGRIPDEKYPRLDRTAFMIAFKAPEGGWTPGTYNVTCTTSKGSVVALFKVQP